MRQLRPHDLPHHAITKLAESSEGSEQTIMSVAGHVSVEMLHSCSHIRQEARRKAVASLDYVEIASQLEKWKKNADDERWHKQPKSKGLMVGTGRFELPKARLRLAPLAIDTCAPRLSLFAR